jgi:hypothetical protein
MANKPIHPTKICTKCGVEKPARKPFFWVYVQYGREYVPAKCADCKNAWRRAKERGEPVGAEWKTRSCRDCSASFIQKNNFQLICEGCFSTNVRRIKAAAESARRARSRQAQGRYGHREFLAQCERQRWRCAYCETNLTEQAATRDHDVPLCRGGSNHISNIVLACGPCNSRKHTLTGEEFKAKLSLS